MPVGKYSIQGTIVTLLSSELNTFATGNQVVSSVNGSSGVFNNLAGGGTANLDGHFNGRFELLLASGHSIANLGAFNIWFLKSVDGTNFERGSATVTPNRAPDVSFFPGTETGAQYLVADGRLPPGRFKVLFQMTNMGAAAQLAGTGNTLRVLAYTSQDV